MYKQEVYINRATQMADPMSRMWRGTHIRIDDNAPTAHAWDGTIDQLELVTG